MGFFGSGDASVLAKLTKSLSHRGPDDGGSFVDSSRGISLGHRRLAIRDVSGGVQPMKSHDGRFVIVYNGELYNDCQLRSELVSLGYRFVTESDTEVLLNALIEWNVDALPRLDGQFAFSFVNIDSQDVVMARDRFGEKPLFWSRQVEGIVFSSESNVLAQHPWVNPKLDEESCIRYLLLGYLPPPYSILQGVQQVRPGHAVCFNLQDLSEVHEVLFAHPWDLLNESSSNRRLDTAFGADLIENAVTSRRVSDVPAGMLLSGGVDSSLLAVSAVRSGWHPPAYTVGFAAQSFDESSAAEEVSIKLGLEHYVKVLEKWDDRRIISILQTLDEPLGDSSYLPTFEAFHLAAERSKVVLTGDGGDELFYGYEPFRAFRVSQIVRRYTPLKIIRLFASAIRKLPRSGTYMNRIDVLERFLDGLAHPPQLRTPIWMSTLRSSELGKFFNRAPSFESMFSSFTSPESSEEELSLVRKFFLHEYLPGSIFAKSDTASMANGVEARTFFFYPSIVRYAVNRRGSDEITLRVGKRSLRTLARALGLNEVAKRRKHGFALPIADVLRSTQLKAPQIALSNVNQESVDGAWSAARAGSTKHLSFLWAALALVNSRTYRLATGQFDNVGRTH